MAHFPLSIAWRTRNSFQSPGLGLDIVNAAQHAWTSNGVGHVEIQGWIPGDNVTRSHSARCDRPAENFPDPPPSP